MCSSVQNIDLWLQSCDSGIEISCCKQLDQNTIKRNNNNTKQHTGPVTTHRYMDSSDENNNNNNKATGVRHHKELPLHFSFLILFLFLFLRQLHLEPAFGGVACASSGGVCTCPSGPWGIRTPGTWRAFSPGWPQHVAFQVHALVAAVAAHAALEGLGRPSGCARAAWDWPGFRKR